MLGCRDKPQYPSCQAQEIQVSVLPHSPPQVKFQPSCSKTHLKPALWFYRDSVLRIPYDTGMTMLKRRIWLLLWVKQVLSLHSIQLACSVHLYIALFAHKGCMNPFWASWGFPTSLLCRTLSPVLKDTVNYLKLGKHVTKLFPAPLKA